MLSLRATHTLKAMPAPSLNLRLTPRDALVLSPTQSLAPRVILREKARSTSRVKVKLTPM
jgi:hypothetical protein